MLSKGHRAPVSLKFPTPELIARFVDIVGPANAVTLSNEQLPYVREWRDLYVGATPVVLRPNTTQQVSAILKLADAERIGVVPQSGNTGLVGGQIPSTDGSQIVLSVNRLSRIRDIDATDGTMIVEAGVTLADVQSAADAVDRLFPLSIASEGSARIGGVLATNAGGTAVLAYGNARHLTLGLEVVLADGGVWNGLRRLKKDNTGYDLRNLMIGSEGTLGIITAATLKMAPKPREFATAIAALDTPDAALEIFRRVEAIAGSALTTFEFWCGEIQYFAIQHMNGVRDPFDKPAPWYALIELSSGVADGRVDSQLQSILADALQTETVRDAVLAQSLQQRKDFWALRESFSEAQKYAGGSIKHDIAVPVVQIPEFLREAGLVVQRICPGARPVPFGHFGDGNVHYNVTQPIGMDKAEYLRMWQPMSSAIHELVDRYSGSISAEHGIGQMKRDDLVRFSCPVGLEMMRSVKAALDPHGILNPGKVL